MTEATSDSERVYFDPPAPQTVDSWWARYVATITNLTPTSKAALESDCRYILDRAILGAGDPGPSWPHSRARTGLVMGSVQSGKTASMLGVSALALDHGIDIVIVLAGTRLSLWRQTYERLTAQLDAGPDSAEKGHRRMLCPRQGVALSDETYPLQVTYQLAPAAVRRKLRERHPLIIVAMKQTDHLHAVARTLRDNVFDAVRQLGRPVHMLVVDDEADDGSVLDAAVEAGQDPVFGNLKQIPRAIANLWDPSTPAPPNLYATYVGYTATPQANLLQEGHNPLAPRDFLVALRTPLDIGHPIDTANPGDLTVPRSTTYPEVQGMDAFYTGGEVFYRRGSEARLGVPTGGNPRDDMADAVRAFLVAGAIRLHRSSKIGPAAASALAFDSAREAAESVQAPHSMLYHPSASITDHFTAAEDILLWAGITDRAIARSLLEAGDARLPGALIKTLYSESDQWTRWLNSYEESSRALGYEFNVPTSRDVPSWQVVRMLLETEVIPGTRVSVVNSDPAADDRPIYTPTFDTDRGSWRASRDLSTIFVSGNVMARGLTLEGMTTALFQRTATNPLADSQMQMQRWFGYRGSYLELCRVFTAADQLTLFAAYHDLDEAVRQAITERMADGAPKPAVLQALSFLATGKIANLRNRPLSPGPKPFVKVINTGIQTDRNAQLVANTFASNPSVELSVGGRVRGRILETPLSLGEAAELLSNLRYDGYQPGTAHELALQWEQVEDRVSATRPLTTPGFYQAPEIPHLRSDVRRDCPYAIPAYLRLWEACLSRPVRGLFVTGDPGQLWSMADLARKSAEQPKFWVGIRYGSGTPVASPPLLDLPFDVPTTNKRVADGEVQTAWGSNDPNAGPNDYRGDEFFDYYHRGDPVGQVREDPSWRPIGSDGQILFYINQRPGQEHPTVAVGVCIPAGGPEQFSAIRADARPG